MTAPARPWPRGRALCRLRLPAVAVLTGLAVLACSSPQSQAGPTPRDVDPGQLTVTVIQDRVDEAAGNRLEARVVNGGTEPVTLGDLRLVAGGFTELDGRAQSSTVLPGQTIDLPMDFSIGPCGPPTRGSGTAGSWTSADPAFGARLSRGTSTGNDAELRRLPVAGPDPLLDRILTARCRQQILSKAVTVDFDADWAETPGSSRPALLGHLVLIRRAAAEPITVSDVHGSVLFNLDLQMGPTTDLAADQQRARPAVLVTPARCDPHALAETKQPYLFLASVGVGAAAPLPTAVPLDDAGQRRLFAYLQQTCGFPRSTTS